MSSAVLFLNMLTVSLTLSAVIILLFLLSKRFGKSVTAKCRYIVWAAVILRLCIPFGAVMLPSLLEVDIPVEVEITAPHTDTQADEPVTAETDTVHTVPPVNPAVPDKITEPSEIVKEPKQPPYYITMVYNCQPLENKGWQCFVNFFESG